MAFGFLALSNTLSNLASVRAHPALAGLLDVQTNPTLFLVIAYAVRIARETLAVADGETIGIVHGSQRESGTKSFVLYTLPAS